MDINQLRYMLAIIESGSLVKAAQRLHISQPALTKSMKRLEEAMGVRLFQRDGRGMSPTPYALHLSNFARTTTSGYSQVLQELVALREGATGVVTLAAPPVLAASVVADAVLDLSLTHPGLQVRILVEVEKLFPSLQSGACDLVFAMRPSESRRFPGLSERLLTQDELIVIARPDHARQWNEILDPRDLTGARWALPLSGNILRGRLNSIYEEAGLPPPKATIECQGPELIKKVVKGGECIGWVPRLGCREEFATSALGMGRFSSPHTLRQVGVFWRDHQLSPAALLLLGALERACAASKE